MTPDCPEWSEDAGSLVVFTGEEDKSGQVHTQDWVPQGALPRECRCRLGKNQIEIRAVRITSSSGTEENTASTTKDNKDSQEENKTTPTITSEDVRPVEPTKEKNSEETETRRSSVESDIEGRTLLPSLNENDQTITATDPETETRDSPVGTPSQRNDDKDDKENNPGEETCESIGVAEELKKTAFKGREIILNRWREYKIELVIEDVNTTRKSDPLILTHDTYFWKCSGSCHRITQEKFCNIHRDCPDGSDESKDNCEVSKLPQKTAFGFYGTLGRKGNQGLVAYFCDRDKTFGVNIGL